MMVAAMVKDEERSRFLLGWDTGPGAVSAEMLDLGARPPEGGGTLKACDRLDE